MDEHQMRWDAIETVLVAAMGLRWTPNSRPVCGTVKNGKHSKLDDENRGGIRNWLTSLNTSVVNHHHI